MASDATNMSLKMTDTQKATIDKQTESQLRQTISNNFNNKKLVEYCESRLSGLNVDTALVEQSEVKVGEVG